MKKCHLSITIIILLLQCFTSYSQQSDRIQITDSLILAVRRAHIIFMDASYYNVSKIAKSKGKKSAEYKKAMVTDSIFQARRRVINGLINTIDELPKDKATQAMESILGYVNSANLIDDNRAGLSPKEIKDISARMKEKNVIVKKKINNTGPNNYLDINIKFGKKNPNHYKVYIFPKWFIRVSTMLRPCHDKQWLNINDCLGSLESFALPWQKGMDKRVERIYTGPFIVLLYDHVSKKMVHQSQIYIKSPGKKFNYEF